MNTTRERTGGSLRLLFYVEQDYSFDILRPLQAEAQRRGHEVRWLVFGDAKAGLLKPGELAVANAAAAVGYVPDAVFVPGDRVPAFIPGLKVEVFHGINEDKRGDPIPERGLFDLYCTQSPAQTAMLKPLEAARGYFRVRETGWLKLDTLFGQRRSDTPRERPQILLASTFTPSLSGAAALYPEIARLSQSTEWQWLVTLHPKMAPEIVARYQALASDNLEFHGTDKVIELLHRADVMVSDNSSILQEFLLLAKPVVSYRNRKPGPFLIDIREPGQLQAAIRRALAPEAELQRAIAAYGPAVTPWRDGKSAGRIMDAVEEMLTSGWRDKKPLNLLRNLKMRRQLDYYRFW
jgi:CDP-glycerol glycerophosphotransferase (TagB/SpsB family)